jgi:hypothetical protein
MPKSFRHPITGDSIGFGKHISWKIQFSIRNWYFIGAITGVTVFCVIWGTMNINVIGWWNVWASYMALFIESVVGISMFEQTRADAKILRDSLAKIEELLTKINQILELEQKQTEEVHNLADALEDEINLHH